MISIVLRNGRKDFKDYKVQSKELDMIPCSGDVDEVKLGYVIGYDI